jgi:hypothetical protein
LSDNYFGVGPATLLCFLLFSDCLDLRAQIEKFSCPN